MHRPLRLLKIDSCHPLSYLAAVQQAERPALEGMSYEEYYAWLMGLRLGLSDYLTHLMNEAGWTAREFVPQDGWLRRKLSESGQVPSERYSQRLRSLAAFASDLTPRQVLSGAFGASYRNRRKYDFIRRYIEAFRPDIIFIREPSHVDGGFFAQFRDRCVIASFIGCDTNHPINWDPFRNDIIFTLTDEYRDFFRVQGIATEHFVYGVDERVAREVGDLPRIHDCTFVGYLGTPPQRAKTELLETVAGAVAFKWWGVKGPELATYPNLERSWQGETAGIDMYKIYRQSKIALNDYVEMNAGKNVNMRSKEVMNVGAMLLTRRAENIEGLERERALVAFGDAEECVAKIRHYLAHEAEREVIGATGLRIALRDFNYRDIAANLMKVLQRKVDACGRSWN
jgi:hypothetical protein